MNEVLRAEMQILKTSNFQLEWVNYETSDGLEIELNVVFFKLFFFQKSLRLTFGINSYQFDH